MSQPKRIVLTGGPGAGKSTLIGALESAGFAVQKEVAREIIFQHKEQDINPWSNRKEFIRLVYEWIIHDLHQPVNSITFCDRGLLDCLAYLKEASLPLPADLKNIDPHLYYSREVFILPPWEHIYCQDWARRQGFQQAVSLYQSIKSTYREYGFQLIEVPMVPLKDRLNFVQQHLKKKEIIEWERI